MLESKDAEFEDTPSPTSTATATESGGKIGQNSNVVEVPDTPSSKNGLTRNDYIKIGIIIVLIAAIVIIGLSVNFDSYHKIWKSIIKWFESNPFAGVAIIMSVYIISIVVIIPIKTILAIATGYIYGFVLGYIIIYCSVLIGCTIAFFVGRSSCREVAMRTYNECLNRYKNRQKRKRKEKIKRKNKENAKQDNNNNNDDKNNSDNNDDNKESKEHKRIEMLAVSVNNANSGNVNSANSNYLNETENGMNYSSNYGTVSSNSAPQLGDDSNTLRLTANSSENDDQTGDDGIDGMNGINGINGNDGNEGDDVLSSHDEDHDRIDEKINQFLAELDFLVEKKPFWTTIIIRLLPFPTMEWANYLLSSTSIPFKYYFFATILTRLISTSQVYVFVGHTAKSIDKIANGNIEPNAIITYSITGSFSLLALIIAFIMRRKAKKWVQKMNLKNEQSQTKTVTNTNTNTQSINAP